MTSVNNLSRAFMIRGYMPRHSIESGPLADMDLKEGWLFAKWILKALCKACIAQTIMEVCGHIMISDDTGMFPHEICKHQSNVRHYFLNSPDPPSRQGGDGRHVTDSPGTILGQGPTATLG